MTSKKTNLKNIFAKNPEHVNHEFVLKAKIKNPPTYINPIVENDKKLRDSIENHLVTIVTPNSIKKVKEKVKQENIKILQSSYENWRVLESSEKININWVDYVITTKWVWATTYYRNTQAINPFMLSDWYDQDEDEKKALTDFPFYKDSWLYDMKKALLELERSQILQEMLIDTEIVLWIYELDEVIWPDWKYVSIKQLEDNDTITKEIKPVILLRAHKSNFRLLDLYMLDKYKRKESIPNLVNHILQESEKHWKTSDINKYIQTLVPIVVKNRLDLIWKFDTLNWERWQDIIRNISVFWEELDLWTMKPMQDKWLYTNPHYVVNHYKSELNNIFIWIKAMINTIEENTDYKVNHKELANIIYDTIIGWIKRNKNELKKHYEENNWSYWEKSFDWFLNWFFWKCFSYFRNYVHLSGFPMILDKKLEKMEIKHKAKTSLK